MGMTRGLSLPTAALGLAQMAQRMAEASAAGAEGAGPAPPASGRFDRCIDALNRLPRPVLTMGVFGLFLFAMLEPEGFARRMQGLQQMPEPLWWLVGAVVTFYFGARERHYRRRGSARAGPDMEPEANPALGARLDQP